MLAAAPRFRRTLGVNEAMSIPPARPPRRLSAARSGGGGRRRPGRGAAARATSSPRIGRSTTSAWRAREEGSGVSSADGRMVFEVTGSACEGYRMRQRMVVNIGDERRQSGLLDFRITTFESGDGDVYSFDSRTTVNQEVVEAVEGEARRDGSDDRGQPDAAGGEDRRARRRRAVPEPAPAGDHRRGAGRAQVPLRRHLRGRRHGRGERRGRGRDRRRDASSAIERPLRGRRAPLAGVGRLFRAASTDEGGRASARSCRPIR